MGMEALPQRGRHHYLSGEIIEEVDEDMKIQVQMHLVEAIKKKWRELI